MRVSHFRHFAGPYDEPPADVTSLNACGGVVVVLSNRRARATFYVSTADVKAVKLSERAGD